MKRATVLFLGPCRKFDPATEQPFPPFSEASRSGRFLRAAIDAAAIPPNIMVRFDNVIPRALFDAEGRERYPVCAELVAELEQHPLWEMYSHDVVVGLSAVVSDALDRSHAKRVNDGYIGGPTLLRLEHPSFMMRRPVQERVAYSRRLAESVRAALRRKPRSKPLKAAAG
jgi:hypothetical protein